jgi:Tfp pilus assembly protein PilV
MQRVNQTLKRSSVEPLKRRSMRCNASTFQRFNGFALYEVLMGVAIFALGVLALGRAVENCLNASALNAEEGRVRLILSNRMAEVQTTPGLPDEKKEFSVDTGYGTVKLIQTSVDTGLKDDNGAQLSGLHRVTLTARWTRAGANQLEQIEFYVYRPG